MPKQTAIGLNELAKAHWKSKQEPIITLPINHIIQASTRLSYEDGLSAVNGLIDTLYEDKDGVELSQIKHTVSQETERLQQAQSEQKTLEATLATLPEWDSACQLNAGQKGGNDRQEVPFANWQTRHQTNIAMSLVSGFILLITSWLSVQAALMDSGLPIFHEQPLLSWLMAWIAPATSIAIKALCTSFKSHRAQWRVRITVYVLATTTFVAWIALFAVKFEGVGGEFDPFAEPNPMLGSAFSFLQIVVEVLVGAALFLNAESIASLYAPDHYAPSLRHEQTKAQLARVSADITKITQRLHQAEGRKIQLDAERNRTKTAARLAYDEHRAKFGDGLL